MMRLPARAQLRQTKQEQQRAAVGPGNAHFISIHQVSSDAATLRCDTVTGAGSVVCPLLLLLLPPLLCIGNLMIKN